MTDTATTGTDASTDATGTDTTDTSGTDTAADETAKWKSLARKHEAEAKANRQAVKDLEALKQRSMTDQEKAVDAARLEARTEALREVGGKLAEAAIRVAAAGRNVDVDALLEGIDPSKFLDAAGDPDEKAITTWIDRIAPPAVEDTTPKKRDFGQGTRGQQDNQALNGDPLLSALKSKLNI